MLILSRVPFSKWVSTWGYYQSFDLWTQFCSVLFSRELNGLVEHWVYFPCQWIARQSPFLCSRLTAWVDFNHILDHSHCPAPQSVSWGFQDGTAFNITEDIGEACLVTAKYYCSKFFFIFFLLLSIVVFILYASDFEYSIYHIKYNIYY